MVYFFATDLVQHSFWHYMDESHPQYQKNSEFDAIFEIYKEVDKSIGELLNAIDRDETTVIIVSDHGFGPNYYYVNITRWLQEFGLLKMKELTFDVVFSNFCSRIICRMRWLKPTIYVSEKLIKAFYNCLPRGLKTALTKFINQTILKHTLIKTLCRARWTSLF